MTSPLRRKRPTTARGRNTPARTAASLAALLLLAGTTLAQDAGRSPYAAAGWPATPQPIAISAPPPAPPAPRPAWKPSPLEGAGDAGVPRRPRPPVPLQRTAFQQPGMTPGGAGGTPPLEYQQLQLEPPGLERLARIDSEPELFERIRQEYVARGEPVTFPEKPILSTDVYYGRRWPAMNMYVAPNYVMYGRLLFQELNSERYGWDLGVFNPLLSAAWFYKDVILLPYHLATAPCRCWDSNAGYCLPGDPVPLMLYPPELSLTGALAEAAAVAAIVAIFP